MSRKFFGAAFASALVLSVAASAQDPAPPQGATPARTPAAQEQMKMVTVEGCLVREADVPGRKPNIAERAGIGEDYILTSTKIVKGSAPAGTAAQARPGEAPTGTAGKSATGPMYEVEGISDGELKQHAGHRVQIEGTFENVARATAPREKGTPADDLVELRGTVIRQVAGECPAKK